MKSQNKPKRMLSKKVASGKTKGGAAFIPATAQRESTSFASIKGGVGKTRAAIPLADWLAVAGKPARLFIDSDLNNSLSYHYPKRERKPAPKPMPETAEGALKKVIEAFNTFFG